MHPNSPKRKAIMDFMDASCIHSFFQKLSPKMIQMLCRIKHVVTKSSTFFKCTSIIFKRICHLPFSSPNVRSMHIWIELWTNFQWYSSRDNPSLCPLNDDNIQGQHRYTASPIKAYGESFPTLQNCLMVVLPHKLASCIDLAQPMSKSQNKHLLETTLVRGLNEIPFGCNNQQHGAEVQWLVGGIYQLPLPRTVSDVALEIPVHISSSRQ